MFRSILRWLLWLFLLTSPLYLPAILSAVISGVDWAIWNTRHVDANVDKYLYEVKDQLNDWGVGGGAPTFREFQDTNNDFHLTRINSNDWTAKLGFVLPKEYLAPKGPDSPEPGIDQLASLDALMRDTGCPSDADKPTEQWLFLSDFAWPGLFPGWDTSFDEVVQYAYAHPRLNQSGFSFATCQDTAGFLCGVWLTRHPALLHFLVEDGPVDFGVDFEASGLTYPVAARTEDLRRVTVRLIEFPLEPDVFTGLPRHVFPADSTAQMLAIVAGDRLYEQFEPHNVQYQWLKRFDEHVKSLWEAEGTWLYYLDQTEDWMIKYVTKPLGLEDALQALHMSVFLSVSGLAMLVSTLVREATYVGAEFLGRPKRGDWILGDLASEPARDPADAFWGGIMGDFVDFLDREGAFQPSAAAPDGDSPPITTQQAT